MYIYRRGIYRGRPLKKSAWGSFFGVSSLSSFTPSLSIDFRSSGRDKPTYVSQMLRVEKLPHPYFIPSTTPIYTSRSDYRLAKIKREFFLRSSIARAYFLLISIHPSFHSYRGLPLHFSFQLHSAP